MQNSWINLLPWDWRFKFHMVPPCTRRLMWPCCQLAFTQGSDEKSHLGHSRRQDGIHDQEIFFASTSLTKVQICLGSQELSKIPMDKLKGRLTMYQKFALATSAHHFIWEFQLKFRKHKEALGCTMHASRDHQCVSVTKIRISTPGAFQAEAFYITAHTVLPPLDAFFKWRFPPAWAFRGIKSSWEGIGPALKGGLRSNLSGSELSTKGSCSWPLLWIWSEMSQKTKRQI